MSAQVSAGREAFVVSVHEHRWLHTSELLASLRVFGAVWRVVPPTPTISKIESNFNSFRSAISRAARRSRASPTGVSSWYYVFEDDIGIVNRSTVAHEMEQAEARAERHQLPLLYGGLCCELGPRCQCHGGNCYGMCAHAWAAHGADYLEVLLNRTRVTARLRSLWNSSCVGTPRCATREGLHHNAQVFDLRLGKFAMDLGGVPVVGPGHRSPQHKRHIGAFYQDRRAFPSTIGR
mmetsp:Transcript_9088/g.30192  ORF Transcript_9088/g.30192 Transcript_9088/m.30192 type:complete len:235 (-) Transcript_9088:118-822(-)